MVMRGAGGLVVATLSVCVASCGAERTPARTELILVADTNIAELSSVTFEVSGEGHATERQSGDMPSDRSPLTLGVVREKGPLGPITAVAHGFVGAREVISRVGIVTFIPGRTVVVPLHLLASCLDVACTADETCTEFGCTSPQIRADDLHEWTGAAPHIALDESHDADVQDAHAGTDRDGDTEDGGIDGADAAEPEPDADLTEMDAGEGEQDAGLDAGTDAAMDAGLDANVPADAGESDAADADVLDAMTDASASDASYIYDCGSPGTFDLANDPAHCGSCTYSCPVTYSWYHAAPTCSAYTCGFRCATLYGNCDQILFVDLNGCETYLGNDTSNCGACNHKCTSGQTCVAGVCTP